MLSRGRIAMRKIIIFLFAAIFLSALSWLVVIPMWHTPDEQAHFAQVAYVAEKGRSPGGGVLDTTEEIYVSEELLGTVRDKVGNNKFTFHPTYNIEYTDSLIGKHEASISALANTQSKKKLVATEATYYPQLYYIPASWLYKVFYSADLFTRVFMIRVWSLVLFIANIFIVYQIGKLIFPKEKLKSLILTVLAGFQPMMIFSNIGVTSDALGNLFFTLFLYSCLRIIIYGINIKELLVLGLVSWLAVITKVQFFIIFPVLIMLLIFLCFRDIKGWIKWLVLISIFLVAVFAIRNPYSFKQFSSITVAADSLKQFNMASFAKFTVEYTLPHTIKEVMPWYWGVYKWLGVTYPRIVHRIINRIVFISILGFVIWFVRVLRRQDWNNRQNQGIFFMLFVSFIYFLAISVYDWLSWYRSGFQLAVQGRYFFPLISVHMMVFLLGWSTILPNKWKIREYGLKLLAYLMAILNIYALYFVASSYYDTSSLQRFIIQASQYKPWLFKGNSILILLILFLISFLVLTVQLFLFKQKRKAV